MARQTHVLQVKKRMVNHDNLRTKAAVFKLDKQSAFGHTWKSAHRWQLVESSAVASTKNAMGCPSDVLQLQFISQPRDQPQG